MKEIVLSRDKTTFVDDLDFGYLSQFKWCTKPGKHTFYAFRKEKVTGKNILMHRVIMGLDNESLCDHIDHDGLNNQRSNLRVATHSQNCINRNLYNKKVSSKYLGVSWCNLTKKWKAEIRANTAYYYLGVFTDEINAALAYNKKALELHGQFANLNKVA